MSWVAYGYLTHKDMVCRLTAIPQKSTDPALTDMLATDLQPWTL